MNATIRASFVALSLYASAAHAIHFDVEIGLDHGPVAGSRITTGVYGDLPFSTLPLDAATGYAVFPADFGDFEGGPKATDDPGFQAFAGTLSGAGGAKDYIGFRALGTLQQWNPLSGTWSDAAAGVGIRLYGAVPPAVSNAYLQYLINPLLAPNAAADIAYYQNGTLFSGSGVSGPAMATIDDANANGGFHAHLDWFFEGSTPGAYLLTLQLTDDRAIGGRGVYVDSEPFHVLFNYGLSPAQYDAAFLSRVTAPVPEAPAAGMLALGLLMVGALARRVRT